MFAYIIYTSSSTPLFLSFLLGTGEELAEWERELQAELQEYEVVNDGDNNLDPDADPTEDADLENEILQQIEAEAAEKS